MGYIMIMAFIVALVSAILFLLTVFLEPVLTTNLVLNLSIYGAILSIQSMVGFVFLYLLNYLFRELQFHHKIERNIVDDIAKVVALSIVGYTGYIIDKFGFYEEELYSKAIEYFTAMI